MAAWQPIKTMPKTGETFLGLASGPKDNLSNFDAPIYLLGFWDAKNERIEVRGSDAKFGFGWNITHWTILPKPPKQTGEGIN